MAGVCQGEPLRKRAGDDDVGIHPHNVLVTLRQSSQEQGRLDVPPRARKILDDNADVG